MLNNRNHKFVFTPPAAIPSSPYKPGEIVKMSENTGGRVVTLEDFGRGFIPPTEISSPFMTPVELQRQTGVQLITLLSAPQRANKLGAIGERSMLIGEKFVQKADGLWCDVQGKCKKICNFYINIRQIVVYKKYYGADRVFLSFDIITENGNLEKSEMPLAEYKKMLVKLTSDYPQLYVNPEFNNAHNHFMEYSSLVYAEALERLVEKIIYDYHGWDEVDGKMLYLSGTLPNCSAEVCVPQVHPARAAQIYLDGQAFLNVGKTVLGDDGVVNSLASLKQILPIFLYAHSGYTAKIFKEAGADMQFVLAIIGQTNSFKTAISRVLFEIFNTRPMLNFQSTARAIELYRDTCRDMVMVLDDIFKCKDKAAMEKFEAVLRCFGDGIAKAKSDATFNKIEQFDVRGGCIITAENDIAGQQSSYLRFLTVHVDRDSFMGTELKKWQDDATISEKNGTATKLQEYFALYIQYLVENYDDIVNMVMRFEPPVLNLEFPRLQSNYKCMAVLAKLVLDCGVYSGALSYNIAEQIYQLWIPVLQDIILDNLRASKMSAPYKLFAYALNQGIGTGMLLLAKGKEQFSTDNVNIFYGYIDLASGYYVLNPDRIYDFVDKYYQKKGGSFQAADTAVYRELYENGISIGYQEKSKKKTGEVTVRTRYLKKVQINGISTQMLVLSIAKFNALVKEI